MATQSTIKPFKMVEVPTALGHEKRLSQYELEA